MLFHLILQKHVFKKSILILVTMGNYLAKLKDDNRDNTYIVVWVRDRDRLALVKLPSSTLPSPSPSPSPSSNPKVDRNKSLNYLFNVAKKAHECGQA